MHHTNASLLSTLCVLVLTLTVSVASAQEGEPPLEGELLPVAPEQPAEPIEPPTLPPCQGIYPVVNDDMWQSAYIDQLWVYRIQPWSPTDVRCWKNLKIEVLDLPKGADFRYDEELGYGEIRWKPTLSDTGRHEMKMRTRAEGFDWREATLAVEVRDDWETYFMPGIQYSVLLPHNSDKYGIFQGISIEYLIVAWIHRNDNRGPSHGRLYFDIDLLQSSEGLDPAVAYHLGLDLSLERNPKRLFMIPYFGLESGGFYQKDAGHVAQLTPFGGVHLWGSQNVFLNVTGGYMFPINALEELRGFRGKVGLNVSFW